MTTYLKNKFALSDKGAKDLVKAIRSEERRVGKEC